MDTYQLPRRRIDIRAMLVCASLLSVLLPAPCFAKGSRAGQEAKADKGVLMTHVTRQSTDRASTALGLTMASHADEPMNQAPAVAKSKMDYIVATAALHREWSGNRIDNLAMEVSTP